MLFNSAHFMFFFPVVVALYFATPHRFRWLLLLASSYYFYMAWKPVYALLLLTSTLIDYFSSHKIERAESRTIRKCWLLISLLTNLGMLFSFKYYNFFSESLQWVSNYFFVPFNLPTVDWLLPVGISFYTFQTLSYTIEVYRGNQKAETHLGYFALYVSFFPQLVAGPIERPDNLLPQFRQNNQFDYHRISNGLKLMVWGMFKKVVIADRLAAIVDPVYSDPSSFNGPLLIFATTCFAFQIYCDFSGYSDIAIGTARVLGINLMRNFNQPYLAHSIEDFWRRWHISLSTWFRDYVYIPLGGNKVSVIRWGINIIVVFLVSGLWHGAAWTFVIWGAIHGMLFVLYRISAPLRAFLGQVLKTVHKPCLNRIFSVVLTFILVDFSWIFFRSNSLNDALYIITHLTSGWPLLLSPIYLGKISHSLIGTENHQFFGLMIIFWTILIFLMLVVEFFQKPNKLFHTWNKPLRWLTYYTLLSTILVFGSFKNSAFIYFQF